MNEFIINDIRNAPFNATKSSENIGRLNINSITDQQRAQTTDKSGPRQKILPKIGESDKNGSGLLPIATLNMSEDGPKDIFTDANISDI